MSLDAKAPVLIGPFSRGGKSRLGTAGADHDFKPWGRLTPFGLFLPEPKELNLFFTPSKVTSDFIVDRLEEWWEANRSRFTGVDRLLLDLDNGPENHSRRSQFVYRLLRLARAHRVTLDSEAAVLGFAGSMTYGGKHPQVSRVDQTYASGVRRSTREMKRMERYLQRLPGLGKWSVVIPPPEVDDLFA